MAPMKKKTPDKDDHHRKPSRRELRRLVRELEQRNQELQDKLRRATAHHSKEASKIPRPRGSAGDGFNLRNEMGLSDNGALYHSCGRTVRGLIAQAGLDHRTVWRHQPKELIVKLFRVARKRQPFLRRFVNDWATEEFAKQYLKNRRAYCRAQGYDDVDNPFRDSSVVQDADGNDDDDGTGEPSNAYGTAGDEEDKEEGPSGTHHDDDEDSSEE